MQNYYKAFSNKQGAGKATAVTKAIFLNSNPYSNYKPLPDQNMMAAMLSQTAQNPTAGG